MVQRVGALVVLSEDMGLIPSITWWFQFQESSSYSDLCRYQADTWCTDRHVSKICT